MSRLVEFARARDNAVMGVRKLDKRRRGENFPVASLLLAPARRAPILAFYRFARVADDLADDPMMLAAQKLDRLAAMRRGLAGDTGSPDAAALAAIMAERGLDPAPARALLDAFVRDVTVARYATWDDLIEYCRRSAMPVGRFVLDVHGERRDLWPMSDALCAALQIINHLQDCGEDYRKLGRIYLPRDLMARHGADVDDLARDTASPALRAVIAVMARRAGELLETGAPLAGALRSRRLAAEVAVIQRLAERLARRLSREDPLRARIAHGRIATALIAASALV